MRRERPILKKHRQTEAAAQRYHQLSIENYLGGENLTDHIVEVSVLRMELGIPETALLAPWCDADPCTCDGAELEHLIERLSLVWASQGGGDVGWFD